MDDAKLVQFNCPGTLLKQVDEKIKRDGIYRHRTDLIVSLLRLYVGPTVVIVRCVSEKSCPYKVTTDEGTFCDKPQMECPHQRREVKPWERRKSPRR